MMIKHRLFSLCVFAVLGLAACGQEQANTKPVGLMATSEAASEQVAVEQKSTNSSETEAVPTKKVKKQESNIPTQPVNINTATAEELIAALKGTGVGKAKVAKIIEYREQHGGFKSVDELTEVKGIGDKTLEKVRPRVTLSGAAHQTLAKKSEKSESKTESSEE